MKNVLNSLANNRFIFYLSPVIICLLILTYTLKLWQADIRIPFAYAYDGLMTGELIKGLIDNKWYLNNSYVGAPFNQELYDFPMSDNLHFILLKILALITNDYAVTLNIYYILGFLLTTFTSQIVMRQFNISYWPSLVVSILFTFLPFHFLRFNVGHLFLASYYMIPLMIMVIIWAYTSDKSLFFSRVHENSKYKLDILNKKSIISIVISFLLASSGVYYAFFACAVLFFCGASLLLQIKENICKLWSILILLFIIIVGVVLNISPTIINTLLNGENMESAVRGSAEADIYGLKLAHLIIPISDHGIEIVAQLKTKYAAHPLSSEGSAYLGVIGVMGLVILLLWLIKPKTERTNDQNYLLNSLSTFNIIMFLVATIGGIGSLFALVISPQIRGYNRISVYIAFISLFAIGVLLNFIYEKHVKSKVTYSIFISIVCLTIFVGLMDQTDERFSPNHIQLKAEFEHDARFIGSIENSASKDSMIFQLPYVPYPEHPPVNKMNDYDHFRGYLHSKGLHWSYGAMKGRSADLWLRNVSSMPVDKLLESLSLAGFNGIYIDRYGYEDNGVQLETDLSQLLNVKPIESDNKRLLYYSLESYNLNHKNEYAEDEWNEKKDGVLHPILFVWRNSGLEGTTDNNWRWFPSEAELEISNTSSKDMKVTLSMGFSTGYAEFSNLSIRSSLFSENIQINASDNNYVRTINIPKGKTTINFRSDAQRVDAPGDPRILNFRVNNFSWKVAAANEIP